MSDSNRRSGPSRGGDGRGEGSRGTSSPLRSSFRETSTVSISLSSVARVHRAADLTRERPERHHEKHREAWVVKAYTKLLLKAAPTLSLTPSGVVNDPKAMLYTRATREVAHKQSQRLTRIDNARYALIATGKLRANRDLEWGGRARAAPERVGSRRPLAPKAAGAVRSTRQMQWDKARGE